MAISKPENKKKETTTGMLTPLTLGLVKFKKTSSITKLSKFFNPKDKIKTSPKRNSYQLMLMTLTTVKTINWVSQPIWARNSFLLTMLLEWELSQMSGTQENAWEEKRQSMKWGQTIIWVRATDLVSGILWNKVMRTGNSEFRQYDMT